MPILGGFLSYAMGSAEFHVIGRFLMITQFTAPAILLAVGALILFVLLYFVFEDGACRRDACEALLPGEHVTAARSTLPEEERRGPKIFLLLSKNRVAIYL